MKDREKYYALDDIGFVGTQKKISPARQRYIQKKTGEVIRKAIAAGLIPATDKVRKAQSKGN